MGLFIFLCIFFIFIWPIILLFWRGHKLAKQWKKSAEDFRKAYYGQNRQQQPPQKKKKIDPSVGEYVSFEEISVTTTTTSQTKSDGSSSIRIESQIEDAVWEEIR